MIDMNKQYLCVLALFFIVQTHAQDIEVKKFEPLEKDQTAVTSPRKDINGNACGLVKVALKEPGAEFEGNVMGDVKFTGNEYLVYMPNGSKRLGIKHPDYLPTTIVFADYGTKRVASSTTYELKVKANKKKAKVDDSKKGMAVFNIKPSNAMLLIDGQIADGSGGAYTLSLPYGTHYYTVKLKDFSINNQQVKIDKNAKNINVDLTEYFAKVNVSCGSADADILVNNETKGVGKWNGLIVPGKCTVEVKKEGYHSLSKTIELMEGDSIHVDFVELKPITGFLRIECEQLDGEVYLDGEYVGKTPLDKRSPIGDFLLEIRKDYCYPYKKQISIYEDQILTVNANLKQTQFGKIINAAAQGDQYGMCMLAELYLYGCKVAIDRNEDWGKFHGENPGDETFFFADRNIAIKEMDEGYIVEKDVEKADIWMNKYYSLYPEGENQEYYLWYTIYNLNDQLMIHYLVGDGVNQDFTKVYFYLNKVMGGGSVQYDYIFAWLYFYGKGVRKDEKKALEHINSLRMFVNNNHPTYTRCNRELFRTLLRSEANYYEWDSRLIHFFENNY